MRITRRALLAAGAGALAGCAPGGDRTQVAIVWAGEEQARFRRVLAGYPGDVEVISAGDDLDQFLRARRRAGTSPDVAVLSRPGAVRGYAFEGALSPLDSGLADRFPPAWNELLKVNGKQYGVWIKAAHKSLLWYRPSVVTQPPTTWNDLVELIRRLARQGPPPLAIGAADGWVLTDWFENVLAALDPATYDALAAGNGDWNGPKVREALCMLADLWGIDGAILGGGKRALLTEHEESVIQVVTGRADLLFEADFVATVAGRFYRPGAEELENIRFPEVNGVQPLVVGGDAAVVLSGSTAGERLVRWLTERDSFRPWIDGGGYLSPNLKVADEQYPRESRELVRQLRAGQPRFDLSDQLPWPLTGGDGVGSWKILQDFFAAVTAGGDPDDAVNRAATALAESARRATGR